MSSPNKLKKKVLVIDDNSGILFVMQEALQLKGYLVQAMESFSGVKAIAESAPDLIYLDVSLAGRDGREISRELKAYTGTKDIPIIILTAYSNAQALAEEAKADGYLSKPFELEQLWKMTARYLSRK